MNRHPTAIIHPNAEIGSDVEIGPYAVIGEHVKLGNKVKVGSHVVIDGWTEVGDGSSFFPFSSIGSIPQDLKFGGEETRIKIGKENTFREFITVNRGTKKGGGETYIGDHNFFMAYVHIAHDCRIGSNVIMANAATLAGHISIGDYAIIGGLV
ncbi:MAG: acyl-ACP--UDP-N-acetylglucosamine O-acyltransferase, partial [Nitrospirota bacterium]